MANQLSHFAIHADDLERARKFYGGPMTDFCQIQDAAGKALAPLGAMQSRKFNSAPQPVIGFECSIVVDDVDAVARAVEANGGKIGCRRQRFLASAGSSSFSTPKEIWPAP